MLPRSPSWLLFFFRIFQRTFDELDEELLRWYVATGEWKGCAGGYQIHRGAMLFTHEMQGTQSGTMGFPMDLILPVLRRWGLFPGKGQK